MNYNYVLICLGISLAALTFIDTIGAVASRKMNFSYSVLAVLSAAIFITCGYLVSKQYTLGVVLLTCGLLGFYDGSIGVWLSYKLKARTGLNPEEYASLINPATTLIMIAISCFFGWIGYVLS